MTLNVNAINAYSRLANDPMTPTIQKRYTDGKMAFHVGDDDGQARVNEAQSHAQAYRNLNFAMANLAAYDYYVRVTGPANDKAREENLRRVEEETKAKREAEAKAAEVRLQQTRLRNGLDLYNKVHGTRHATWNSAYSAPLSTRELWAKQAEEVARLQRASNPFTIANSISNTLGMNPIRTRIF